MLCLKLAIHLSMSPTELDIKGDMKMMTLYLVQGFYSLSGQINLEIIKHYYIHTLITPHICTVFYGFKSTFTYAICKEARACLIGVMRPNGERSFALGFEGDRSTLQAKGTAMHINTVKQAACPDRSNRAGQLQYSTIVSVAGRKQSAEDYRLFKFRVR